LNVVRGIFGAVSFFLYIYAVIVLPLAEVVIILWTIPLFSLVLSKIFLGENVTKFRWIATLVGFIGLTIITTWTSNDYFQFNILYCIPIGAAFLFALQDILIKKMVTAEENRITMLFYFALITSLVSFPAACKVWLTPTPFELMMLFLLGLGGNFMQYFIFKTFSLVDVSAVAPYRYLELLVSAVFAFIFFFEIPGKNVYAGALILIPCTLYLGYSENLKKRKSKTEI
jgi:S-adenosylmethionine uptake transporter